MLDEPDQKIRENMIQYMGELFEDATDFSWQGAKAAHAVLLCEFERGTLNWENTARIDRIYVGHMLRNMSIQAGHGGKVIKILNHGIVNSSKMACAPFQKIMR